MGDTIFVRNLNKTSTRDDLLQLFSQHGVVKHCVVVCEKGGGGSSKGFGFVTFSTPSDAHDVLSRPSEFTLQGKKLRLEMASKDKASPEDENFEEFKDWRKKKQEKTKPTLQELERQKRTVVLFNVDLDEHQLRKRLKKRAGGEVVSVERNQDFGNKGEKRGSGANDDGFEKAKKEEVGANEAKGNSEEGNQNVRVAVDKGKGSDGSDVVSNDANSGSKSAKANGNDVSKNAGLAKGNGKGKKDDGSGVVLNASSANHANVKIHEVWNVVYASSAKLNSAVKEINGRTWGESTVFARRFTQVANNPQAKAKCRLIVRNVGFHVTNAALKAAFEEHGPVEEAVLTRNETTKQSRGFGFVQFFCRSDAAKAVEALNGAKELGPKSGRNTTTPSVGIAVDFALTKEHYEALKAKKANEPEVAEVEEQEEEHDVGPDSEEEDDEDDAASVSSSSSSSSSSSASSSSSSSSPTPVPTTRTPTSQPSRDKGVTEGRTLFITNLLFESSDETIRKRFSEFGPVRGIKIVKDYNGRSRGTCFVEFWSRETTDNALNGGEIMLEGRVVYAKRAVDRELAVTLKAPSEEDEAAAVAAMPAKEKKKKEDKRHLYLAGEGRVPIENIPQADKKKRQGDEEEKRTKLKNPLFFVSPTRLSVRNLNRKPEEAPDSGTLKRMFKEAAIRGLRQGVVRSTEGDRSLFPLTPGKAPSVRVVKVLLMRDDEDPFGRSSGFGFVEFTEHYHALCALRVINNNPEFAFAAAGGQQAMKLSEEQRPRLIVSFSIENAAKVRQQKLRQDKGKATNAAKAKADEEEGPKKVAAVAAAKAEAEDKNEGGNKKTEKPDSKKRSAPLVRDEDRGNSRVNKQPRPEKSAERPRKPKHDPKDITNATFERKAKKSKVVSSTTDDLDIMLASRRQLFDDDAGASKKKRWFEDDDD